MRILRVRKGRFGSSITVGRPKRRMLLALVLCSAIITGFLLGPTVPKAQAATAGTYFDNIVFVAMENQDYSSVMGDGHGASSAPYIATLLAQGGTIPNFHGAACGGSSENSYLAVFSGDTWGCPGNGARDIGDANTVTLVNRLEARGITWHAMCESSCGRDGDHFPFIDFTSIVTNAERMSHVDVGGVTTTDLVNLVRSANPPTFIWWTPEDNHNMHDNSVSSGDSYLQGFVPQILSSSMFTSGRALLLLWWDEYNPAPIAFVGPTVKTGYISQSNNIDHYSVLRLIEANWNMPAITGNDAGAAVPTDIFQTGPPGSPSASFVFTPVSPAVGQTVTFTGTASGGTAPYTYSWTFGDGATGAGQSATHSYSAAGTYSPVLTVTDSASRTGTSSRTIIVVPPPTPDFTIVANPDALTLVAGDSGVSGIGLASINSFSGTVSFTVTSNPSGPSLSLNPGSVSLASGGSASTTLTIGTTSSIQLGSFDLTVTATSGAVSHTVLVLLTVDSTPPPPDFAISASPPSVTLDAGTSGGSTVTVRSVNGFSGTVFISGTADTGLGVSLGSSLVALSAGGSRTITVTIIVSDLTAAGSYSVTITGTSGALLHSVNIQVQVNVPPLNSPPVLLVPGPQTVIVGSSITFSVTASDPDLGNAVTLNVNALPAGASFDAVTGEFSWTPGSDQVGTYYIAFTATDDGVPSLSVTRSTQVNVEQAGPSPPPSQPPSTNPQGCPWCNLVPAMGSNMFLLVVGGLVGLTTVLSVTYLRARSKVEQARRLRRLQRNRD